ncbi:hypothetical protein ARMGADRAFT_739453 [Armillaria gallica]|uniref:Secreted protein n=1 Tax=Armillaria gallica TaxID=47427 RepID=A0A2H3D1J4_ARMGA|nr:hypothetical protein ARMGADRAFT_739453 [Armillaria gallica]
MSWWTLIKLVGCSGGRCSCCFWSRSRGLTGIYIIFDVAPLEYRSHLRKCFRGGTFIPTAALYCPSGHCANGSPADCKWCIAYWAGSSREPLIGELSALLPRSIGLAISLRTHGSISIHHGWLRWEG